MEFKKYPSITNSYNQKFLDYIKEFGAVIKFFSYDILAEFRSVPFNDEINESKTNVNE